MRSGMIALKMGMTRVFAEDGEHIPVTILKIAHCQVVAKKSLATDGYNALQLGVGFAKVKRVSKQMRGHFAKAEIEPKRKLCEFRVSEDALIDVGATILVDHFVAGQKVDVVGTSIGKGFAGAMKRHNFHGLRASHGVSVSHRSHGSTGNSQDPGKVWKGKKMAGHMGDERVTTQNLTVVSTDIEKGIILVKGAVPGSKGSYVLIKDSIKKQALEGLPYPASIQLQEVEEAVLREGEKSEDKKSEDKKSATEVDTLENAEPADEIDESVSDAEKVSADVSEKEGGDDEVSG